MIFFFFFLQPASLSLALEASKKMTIKNFTVILVRFGEGVGGGWGGWGGCGGCGGGG